MAVQTTCGGPFGCAGAVAEVVPLVLVVVAPGAVALPEVLGLGSPEHAAKAVKIAVAQRIRLRFASARAVDCGFPWCFCMAWTLGATGGSRSAMRSYPQPWSPGRRFPQDFSTPFRGDVLRGEVAVMTTATQYLRFQPAMLHLGRDLRRQGIEPLRGDFHRVRHGVVMADRTWQALNPTDRHAPLSSQPSRLPPRSRSGCCVARQPLRCSACR